MNSSIQKNWEGKGKKDKKDEQKDGHKEMGRDGKKLNWHDIKISGMCTQCMLYSLSVHFLFVFICTYNAYIKVLFMTNIFYRYKKKRAYFRKIRSNAASVYSVSSSFFT